MSFSRKGIIDLKLYVPGRSIDEVKRQYGIDDVVKLASNENWGHLLKGGSRYRHSKNVICIPTRFQ